MASTYSNNLRIELIGTGDQSGAWGNTTNSNLGLLIEQAITGYQLVTTTVSPSYLQASNGTLDEARNAVVALATTTGAAFSVAIPPREKTYVFVNTSSHAATIYAATGLNVTTVPSPAGATVTIPAGKSMLVYCDGAGVNVMEAVNHVLALSAGSLALSTPLPTSSGGTGSSSTAYCSLTANVSGALPVANGGTGQTSYTNGQLLIGNTTGNTLTKATLTGTTDQVVVTNAGGSITLSTPQSLATTSDVQFDSLGIGSAPPATTGGIRAINVQLDSLGVGAASSGILGEIRAIDNVTAYYSSDKKYKEDIREIPNALDIVSAVGGKMFTWTDDYVQSHGGEDGYFVQKEDFGVIAQDVQAVFPAAVRTRPDGSLAVDYAKLSAVAFAAIIELRAEIMALKGV
jgi:hypothetical protein